MKMVIGTPISKEILHFKNMMKEDKCHLTTGAYPQLPSLQLIITIWRR